MKRVLGFVALVTFASLVGNVRADDKPNPTGTWKWTVMMGGNSRDVTLKLKLDGDKLTGTMPGRNNNETKIDDGATFKNGEITFTVTRERNGNKTVTTYKGKLDGDTIKGKISREGQEDRDWEAKRAKD
jgi:hypothetical protein